MGMTIDEMLKIIKDGRIVATIIKENNEDDTKFNQENIEALNTIVDTMRKYQMFQLDYEARLKADMVAMLIELKNKLIDKSWNIDMYDDDLDFECCYLNDIDGIIQQIGARL